MVDKREVDVLFVVYDFTADIDDIGEVTGDELVIDEVNVVRFKFADVETGDHVITEDAVVALVRNKLSPDELKDVSVDAVVNFV